MFALDKFYGSGSTKYDTAIGLLCAFFIVRRAEAATQALVWHLFAGASDIESQYEHGC